MAKVENVAQFIEQHSKWSKQLMELRKLLASFNLTETIKWGSPVYTKDGKNLFGIGAFKNHYGIWFFQGALLKNNTELLVNAQEGKTQAMRQIKLDENINLDMEVLKPYIIEAIAAHDEGKKVQLIQPNPVEPPTLIINAFNKDQKLKEAFDLLSQGKQKEYSLFLIEAKKEETKHNRLNKIIPMILSGIVLNDKYKNG